MPGGRRANPLGDRRRANDVEIVRVGVRPIGSGRWRHRDGIPRQERTVTRPGVDVDKALKVVTHKPHSTMLDDQHHDGGGDEDFQRNQQRILVAPDEPADDRECQEPRQPDVRDQVPPSLHGVVARTVRFQAGLIDGRR